MFSPASQVPIILTFSPRYRSLKFKASSDVMKSLNCNPLYNQFLKNTLHTSNITGYTLPFQNIIMRKYWTKARPIPIWENSKFCISMSGVQLLLTFVDWHTVPSLSWFYSLLRAFLGSCLKASIAVKRHYDLYKATFIKDNV